MGSFQNSEQHHAHAHEDGKKQADADSAFTGWNTLSADNLSTGRDSYSSSLMSTSRSPYGTNIKATYGQNIIKFGLPLTSSLVDLEKNVKERLHELKDATFRIKYKDDEGDWILITNDDDLQNGIARLQPVDQNTIHMLIEVVQHSKRNPSWLINPQTLHEFALILALVLPCCFFLYSLPAIFSWICSLSLTLSLPLVALLLMMVSCSLAYLFSPRPPRQFVSHSKHMYHSNIVLVNEEVGCLTYSTFCPPYTSCNHPPGSLGLVTSKRQTIGTDIIDVASTTKECVVDTNKDCAMVVETLETKVVDGQPSNKRNPGSELEKECVLDMNKDSRMVVVMTNKNVVTPLNGQSSGFELEKGRDVMGVAEGLVGGISSPKTVMTNKIKVTMPNGCGEGPNCNSFTALADEVAAEQDHFGLVEEIRTRNLCDDLFDLHEMWGQSVRFQNKAHLVGDGGN